MCITCPSATTSSASARKINGGVSAPISALALLCLVVSCAIPVKAWANRTVTLNNNQSGCAGTLQVSGDGWGKWSKKKPDKIAISVQNSSALPVQGVIANTTVVDQKFSVSIHYSVFSPCSSTCSSTSTVTVTAKGQKGNTASSSIDLPGLYCGIIWAP